MTEVPEKIRTELLPRMKAAGLRNRIVCGWLDGTTWAYSFDANGAVDDEMAMQTTEEEFERIAAGFRAIGAMHDMQRADAALSNMAAPSKAIN